jgi:hypothetical protein
VDDSVCTVWDEYMIHYAEGNPIWIVTLNNGETVYRDDGRPGLLTHNAWRRLYHYCEENSLHIISMTIGFRDNRYALTPNADGYYFALGARGMFGGSKTTQLFFVGTLQNTSLVVQCWRVPEMLEEESEVRSLEGCGECLIQRR